MPNRVKTKIYAPRDVLDDILKNYTTKNDEFLYLDFEKIIPKQRYIYDWNLSLEEEKKYWYDNCWYWRQIKNWWTKWNSFELEDYEDHIEIQTAWSTPTSKVLVESKNDTTKGWRDNTTIVKVKYGNIEKELRIRPETPSFDINKDGELVIPNFEQVKSQYESKVDFLYDDFIGQYKQVESMEDLQITTHAEEYLYIRLKATDTMLASYPFAIWEDDAIVESVSEIKYDKNNVAYRKIEPDWITYIVTAKNTDDKYLNQLGFYFFSSFLPSS